MTQLSHDPYGIHIIIVIIIMDSLYKSFALIPWYEPSTFSFQDVLMSMWEAVFSSAPNNLIFCMANLCQWNSHTNCWHSHKDSRGATVTKSSIGVIK